MFFFFECHFNKAAKASQEAFTLNESLPLHIIYDGSLKSIVHFDVLSGRMMLQ